MSTVDAFTRQLALRVADAEQARPQRAVAFDGAVDARPFADARFAPLAACWQHDILRPRLASLVSRFDNAEVLHGRTATGVQTVVTFVHTERFPATAKLTLGLAHEAPAHAARAFVALQVDPALIDVEAEAHLDVPLACPDDEALADWLEQRLLAFLETSLRLETDQLYQRTAMVADPVCGRWLSAADSAARELHLHRMYSFCSAACHAKFVAGADYYVAGGMDIVPT